jgi:hypothetical protein
MRALNQGCHFPEEEEREQCQPSSQMTRVLRDSGLMGFGWLIF